MSIGLIAEGVSNEAFGCQFGTIEIVPGQTRATDVKLSWHSYWNRLQMGIQQVDLRIGDRTANRNGFCPFQYILHKVPGCEGGTLRRPIDMEQSLWGTMFEHLFDPLGINGFTAKEQVTHRTKGPWNFACQQVEQRRRQEHGTNPLFMQLHCEVLGRKRHVLGNPDKLSASKEGAPNLKSGSVEGGVRDLGHPVDRF